MIKSDLQSLLDRATGHFENGRKCDALDDLVGGLYRIKSEVGSEGFTTDIVPACRKHRVCSFLEQEPITRHALLRPRGYPGDADLLDLYYRVSGPKQTDSEFGKSLYQCVTARSGGQSVRIRLQLLGEMIDQANSALGDGASIMSIACGHFREGQFSQAVKDNRLKRVICLDQDLESIQQVRDIYMTSCVEARQVSVLQILSRNTSIEGRFDFVYAAGLYDYLETRVAQRLTFRMFEFLAPGGKLLVANFAPETKEQGYMEAFMNWKLIYRTEEEVRLLASEIPSTAIAETNLFRDAEKNVIYFTIRSSA